MSSAPQWGGPFTRALGRWALRLLGWQLRVDFPEVPRLVIVGAPHTSNWDGILAVTAIMALGVRINWFAKDSLFRWPFRRLLIALGGVPIARQTAAGIVEQTTAIFAAKSAIYIAVAPEGTRGRTPVWKSGFYRIALASQTPILLAYVDYARRVVGSGPLIKPSGDYAADLATIQQFYRGIRPRHPERFAAEG